VTLRIGLVLYAICSVPYVYGALSSPPDRVYTGLLFNVPDHVQYWAWVTASRHALFISNTLTPELNPPLFANTLMWLLARVKSAFGLSFPALFQVWRLAATLLFVFALRRLLDAMVEDRRIRRTAFWVAVLGSGFGWMLVTAKYVRGAPDVSFPLDLYVFEPNSLASLLAYPYLPLAQGLMLLSIGNAFVAHRTGRPANHAIAAISAGLLASCHAYDLVVVYAVLGAYWLYLTMRARTIPWRFTGAVALVAACSAPIAGYYAALSARDPLWHAVYGQYDNLGVRTPSPIHVAVMMGLPLLLAIGGLRHGAGRDEGLRFARVWAIVQFALLYVPAPFQIKMLATWQVPLAILSAHVWHRTIAPRLTVRLGRRAGAPARDWALTALLLALVVPTNIYLFAWRMVDLGRHQHPYYLRRDEMAALQWLAQNGTPADVVLARMEIGQFVPGYSGVRSYLAHAVMTARFYERREDVSRFFDRTGDDTWRRGLLARGNVTFVLRTDGEETADADAGGWHAEILEPALLLPHAQVYRVRPPGPHDPSP
jgi:hypothetical protein